MSRLTSLEAARKLLLVQKHLIKEAILQKLLLLSNLRQHPPPME